jgi:hypothetical protein
LRLLSGIITDQRSGRRSQLRTELFGSEDSSDEETTDPVFSAAAAAAAEEEEDEGSKP